ncbi:hypothetical protein PENTCL1PPCAC_4498, partial [Pristionchus entomophagus]
TTTVSPSEDPDMLAGMHQMSDTDVCKETKKNIKMPTFVKKARVAERKNNRMKMKYFSIVLIAVHGIFVIFILVLHCLPFRGSSSPSIAPNVASLPSGRAEQLSEQAPPSIVMEPIHT